MGQVSTTEIAHLHALEVVPDSLIFLSDEKLREIIQSTTNKMEQFNAFCKWLLFGGEGKISDTTPEDQEKRIKYNDLIANCVILNNTVELSEKLNILAQEGYALTKDELIDSIALLSFRLPLQVGVGAG